MIDPEQLSYIAGFLDGEGCFVLGNNWKPSVAVENTYRPVIDMLRSMFGGSVFEVKGKKKNHRTTYRWCVVCDDAVQFCQQIAPFLKEKTEQALILISSAQTKHVPKVGTKLHPEVIEQRQWFRRRLVELKGRL